MGYALEDAARVLECDRSKISRIETGQRGIRPKELRELLTEYGVPESEQAALVSLARRGGQRGWWDQYADALPRASVDYVIMEATAAEIMTYEAQLVPDLLQTEDYARAVAAAEPDYGTDGQRELAVAAKAARQETVLGGIRRLSVVIGEAALRQQVGSPEIMREQLSHLADQPAAEIRVLPFGAGAHAISGAGPLQVVRFGAVPALGAVRVPDPSGGHCLIDPADVAACVRTFASVRAAALTAEDSRALLISLCTETAGPLMHPDLARPR